MSCLAAVLPEYRLAAARGQIEISTTPYYHPILPLLCDSDIARVANPHTPLPSPLFVTRRMRESSLRRARQFHERCFGKPPAGLWPSEGSVSDQALEIAAELGFQVVCDGRRRARADAEYRILARRFRISGEWPGIIHAVAIQPGRAEDDRIFPRSLFIGSGGIRLQPHGCGRGGGGFASPHSRDRRPRTRGANGDRQRHPRRRKCVGILPGKRPGIPAAVLRAD